MAFTVALQLNSTADSKHRLIGPSVSQNFSVVLFNYLKHTVVYK